MPSMGSEYNKKYYEKNKEYFKNYVGEKGICEICKIGVTRSHKPRHERSIMHIKNKIIYELKEPNKIENIDYDKKKNLNVNYVIV